VLLKHFPRNICQAGRSATDWRSSILLTYFNGLQGHPCCNPVSRRGHNPQNLDFVNSGVTENTCLNEADSKVVNLPMREWDNASLIVRLAQD
jgi:hypothetical protein